MRAEAYLNQSQLLMWERTPKQYRKVYIEGIQTGSNRGQALGTEIAEALEHGEDTGDPLKDLVLAGIPKLELRDQIMFADLPDGNGGIVPIRIKPDLCGINFDRFKEVKTGPAKTWNQQKVDKHDQITFYSMGIYLLKKKLPTDIELVHAVTEYDENGRPHLTGEIKIYKTYRSFSQVLQMMARSRKAWREIGELMDELT